MIRRITLPILAAVLLFCAIGCRQEHSETAASIDSPVPTAAVTPVPTPEPTATPEPTPVLPYRDAFLSGEPSDTNCRTIALSLYDAGMNNFDGKRLWTVTFSGLTLRTVDRFANPMRFSDDLSVWMTYDRDGDWDNCSLGRCISDETDWNWLDSVLFSREYEADPSVEFFIQTPRFIVRKGDLCLSSTSIRDVVGKTYYIDDEVCTYWIKPDGTVVRTDADGSRYRAVETLTPEEVAYLCLLYEAHYMTPAIQYPCPAVPEQLDQYHLLIERNGVCTELPPDSFEAFTALVTVPEDQTLSTWTSCFACKTEMFANADYPSPEVLRFRFVQEGYDPDQSPYQWFSLREDGKIIRETPLGAGFIHTVARWRGFGKNRIVSEAVFSVDDILAFVKPYGIE